LSKLAAHKDVRQFARFLIAGLSATAVQYAVLIGLVEAVHIQKLIASVAGYGCGAIASYLLNRYFTFAGSGTHFGVAAFKFAIMVVIGLALNTAIFAALTHFGLFYIWAQMIATGLVLFFNFACSRLFVFR
jgi:putative flippase GtrA